MCHGIASEVAIKYGLILNIVYLQSCSIYIARRPYAWLESSVLDIAYLFSESHEVYIFETMRTIFYGEYLLVVLIEFYSILSLPWIGITSEWFEFIVFSSAESTFLFFF